MNCKYKHTTDVHDVLNKICKYNEGDLQRHFDPLLRDYSLCELADIKNELIEYLKNDHKLLRKLDKFSQWIGIHRKKFVEIQDSSRRKSAAAKRGERYDVYTS